jgi:uncharacterized protein
MPKMIFLNLPVSDLDRSVAFYEGVGAIKNPQFSNDKAACMVLSETIFVMLLTHGFYSGFTSKPIADAHSSSQALFCVSEDSREAVDRTIERAAAGGGRADPGPTQDHGFMYGRSFEDPDGHHWEVMWMDVSQAPPTPDAA